MLKTPMPSARGLRVPALPTRRAVLSQEVLTPLAGFAVVLLACLWVSHQSGASVLGHSFYDSYTLEALAWRDGHAALSQNYEWLELAVYKGQYWVSFPPLPAVPMFFLSFLFGENTPSAGVTLVYFFAGLGALYALLRRRQSAGEATMWVVFIALGGTILSIVSAGDGVSGGVWFQAQLMAFMLTALAFLFVDGDSRRSWIAGLACLALAVGCRPFNAIYLPVLLLILVQRADVEPRALLRMLAPAAAIGAVFAIYNAARFGNPLEFGHKYLPELRQAGTGMFLPSKVPEHLKQVLVLPSIDHGKLSFPQSGGFAVYLTNPMLVLGLGVLLVRGIRRKAGLVDVLLFAVIVVHTAMLLSHRVNGGYQYGTRYLVDLIPAATYAIARGGGLPIRNPTAMLMGALIAFNVYAIVFFEGLLT